MGRFDESIKIVKETLEIDPLSPVVYNELGSAMQFVGQYNEALEQYNKGLELAPDFPQGHVLMADIYSEMGIHDKAVEHCRKLLSLNPDVETDMGYVGYYYGMAGQRAEALKILDELKERSKKKYISFHIANIYLGLGDKEHALEWLEKAYDEHDINLVWLKVDPKYDSLRDNPHFQDLLRRKNFPK
jgi:tetratricopeptide (TPR) repeat protein